MPTSPLSSNLQNKLDDATAWKFETTLGPVFTPRFFCCDDPNSLSISGGKEPVAIIDLDPNPSFTGDGILYTGTASYDPDGSITAYAWSFEGHSPSSGTASNGTLSYATAGTYTIELTVTDGTGLQSNPARQELVVVAKYAHLLTGGSSGVYYSDGNSPITWTAKNTGLSGNDLIVYDVIVEPSTSFLPDANKTIWRATTGGIQVSNDGGATWAEKVPGTVSNAWADSPAPTVSDLTWRDLHFNAGRLFAMATWQNGSSAWRSWIFYTDNAADMVGSTAGTVTWTEI
jgi:hypothetical protein